MASATFFIDDTNRVRKMSGMDTFNEHDMATAKGFSDADAYYADLHEKSMLVQEYDELRQTIERIFDDAEQQQTGQ